MFGKIKKIFLMSMILILGAAMVFSQDGGGKKNRSDYLTVKIAVIGPGDELYFWWGHLGLIIEDELTGNAQFVDYGVFSFEQDHFFSNFAFGRLWYTTAESPADAVIQHYIRANRDVTAYTLDLSGKQKEEVLRITASNLKPENKDYLYNHFSDNCVTRVTNTLDAVLDGQFYAKAASIPGDFTLRQEIRRFMARHPFWDILLNFWMGQAIDKKISVKEEMFLPEEAGTFIEQFTFIDADGNEKKLTSRVDKIHIAEQRPPFLNAPCSNVPGVLVAGIILAALFCIVLPPGKYPSFPSRARQSALRRRLFGVGNALLGLIAGSAGSVLLFMEFFSNHDYTYQNSNILFANPLVLAAIPLGILFAFSRNEARVRVSAQGLRILWTYVFLTALLAVVIKVSPAFHQDNGAQLALVIPVSLALSKVPFWILLAVRRRHA